MNNNMQGRIYIGARATICGITITGPCGGCFLFLGISLTVMGSFMSGFAYNDPFRDDPFFSKYPSPLRIIGPVFLGFGIFFIFLSAIMFIVLKTNLREQLQQQPFQPTQPEVNIYIPPSNQGSAQPYPPHPGYQQMNDKACDNAPPPYSVSTGQSAPPYEPPSTTQPAYNPSNYGAT